MKISSVDQRNFHGGSLELLRSVQARKTSAQDQNPVLLFHRQFPLRSNLRSGKIIQTFVNVLSLTPSPFNTLKVFSILALGGLLCLAPRLIAQHYSNTNSTSALRSSASASAAPPIIVIGFLGGYVRHDDPVHSTVQLADRLRSDFPSSVHIETFENRRIADAHRLILDLLDPAHHRPTAAEKRDARIVLYGHSWGANAVVALARELKSDGIPVLLTVQVDSVARYGQDDSIIPDNVAHAANFFQDQGFLHGQKTIRAEDARHTQILGNFRVDYSKKPIDCPAYPWYDRVFMRSHIEIECDAAVWQQVDNLIRSQLPASPAINNK
jgi:hypothetical protein